jgi:predicted alpha/beta superfamily hydrolase
VQPTLVGRTSHWSERSTCVTAAAQSCSSRAAFRSSLSSGVRPHNNRIATVNRHIHTLVDRRHALTILGAMAASGCGGGTSSTTQGPPQGDYQSLSIESQITRTTYPLSIYAPASSLAQRSSMTVIYALDGETWFQTLTGIVTSADLPVIVIAIHTAGQRNRDFVPTNSCTSNGGGQERYLDFLRKELLPFVEKNVGGASGRRILFGHSHGGSFVLSALLSEPASTHSFQTYIASDSSISCMSSTIYEWERAYASANSSLPARVHLSYATQGNYQSNLEFSAALARRSYSGLSLISQSYGGSHLGIVPQALTDAMAFALVSVG